MTPQEQIKKKKDRIKTQKEWYKKLKDEGFNDIETLGTDGEIHNNLKDSHKYDHYIEGGSYDREEQRVYEVPSSHISNMDYYKACNYLLEKDLKVKVFRIPPDRDVWALHCEGVKTKRISELTRFSVISVRAKIKKYEKLLT